MKGDVSSEFSHKTGLEGRLAALKRSIENMMDQGLRKTTFYPLVATSLAETVNEPQQIRRAKAFKYLLNNVKLEVHPHEILGGSILGMWPLDSNPPSFEEQYAEAEAVIEAEINPDVTLTNEPTTFDPFLKGNSSLKHSFRFALMARDHYNANCVYSRLQTIIKKLQDKYEGSDKISGPTIARLLEFHFNYDYGKETMDLIDGLPWYAANHIALNYGRVVHSGFGRILQDIEAKLAVETDNEKKEFYTATQISYKAVISYIQRYAQTYLDAAKTESDPIRIKELEEIGRRMDKISTAKPESFKEAMQLLWITHVIANTQLGCAISFGRFDQYMVPYYDKDIKSGAITKDEVTELLCNMMLKVNEPKMRTVQSVALGGTTTQGENGANELTRAFLQASRLVRLPYPNISLRVAKDLTPEWAYDEAIETIKCGFGMPMLINDDLWIKNFQALGYSPEIARDYYNMGCVEMLIQNKHAGWWSTDKYFVLYPDLMQEVLHAHQQGESRFNTFDELYQAILTKIKEEVRGVKVGPDFEFFQAKGYDPFASILVDGCLEQGKDMGHGGAEIPAHIAISGQGLATVVDSLATIKTVVYDQKRLTLDKLIEITENDFKGEEGLRQYILNTVPHYGNDIEWVDKMAAEMFYIFTSEMYKLNDGSIPQKYVSSYFSYTTHVSLGEITPSTPDGRLKGVTLSDNLGPSQGRDTEGPTKLMNSLLRYDYSYLNGANATNIKVNPNLFATKGGIAALKNLLLTYLRNGGPQVQVNFVSHEDLLDAQINPMKHRDLIVRIAGFCEYFIYLDFNQQNEIIMRTEHS